MLQNITYALAHLLQFSVLAQLLQKAVKYSPFSCIQQCFLPIQQLLNHVPPVHALTQHAVSELLISRSPGVFDTAKICTQTAGQHIKITNRLNGLGIFQHLYFACLDIGQLPLKLFNTAAQNTGTVHRIRIKAGFQPLDLLLHHRQPGCSRGHKTIIQ